MELSSQDDLIESKDVQYTSRHRINTFLAVSGDAWEKLHLLIEEKRSESSEDLSFFEMLRPMPDIYLSDVENEEYKNKSDRDIGDVAVVVVDGILHDTKRSIWISKNWGCDLPGSVEFISPGYELPIKKIFPEATEIFISKTKLELEKTYNRLGCKKNDIGFIHIASNAVPTTFFEYLSDTLNCKFEFMAIDSVEMKASHSKFYDVVTLGSVSDWGMSLHRKPFTLENYSASSIFIKFLLFSLVTYLLYSYLFGA